jgi:hypothetical protein
VQGKNVGDNKYSRYPLFIYICANSYILRLLKAYYADFSVQKLTLVAELRIHEETERGDNDSIKMPNGQKVKIEGKKCCS